MSVLPRRWWVCHRAVHKAIVVYVMAPLSLQQQLLTGMSGACQVSPRCEPWRWQRVTQSLPITLGTHNPLPHSLQHQLSTGMPRACHVTPGCQPWRCQRVTPDIPHMWGMCSPGPEFIEALAKLVQKPRVRVKQHLQVHVQGHQAHLRARHEKE